MTNTQCTCLDAQLGNPFHACDPKGAALVRITPAPRSLWDLPIYEAFWNADHAQQR